MGKMINWKHFITLINLYNSHISLPNWLKGSKMSITNGDK